MRSTIFAAAAALFLPVAAQATTIGFDALDGTSGQTVPLPNFTEGGFTFAVTGDPLANNSPGIAVFDTTCTGAACNGDVDLTPQSQGQNGIEGNILIFQEGGSANTPDDAPGGGTFVLTLLDGPAFRFLGGSAIDDATFDFGVRIGGVDTILGTINNGNVEGNDGGSDSITFVSDILNIGDSIIVTSSGSGGIDSLILEAVPAVPVPAAMPLLVAGLAGFGFVARRKRKST
ncbi:MAG: VPLPA-CTERM sorting domain-containing protein [Pseudomonadota bacterium]